MNLYLNLPIYGYGSTASSHRHSIYYLCINLVNTPYTTFRFSAGKNRIAR